MSKALLKAWEKAKRAELGAQIAGMRARTAHEIKAKRRAEKEGKLCPGTMAPKAKRTKRAAPKKRPPAPKRAPKKKKTKRTKRR